MQFRLQTLLIAGAVGPPLLAGCWFIAGHQGVAIIFVLIAATAGFWFLVAPPGRA
jgi:hypothetical protein